MPPMFWLNKPHPSLVGRGLAVNNSYLQVMDTCEEAATAWTEQDVHWPVPGETPADATDDVGWLHIGARDHVHLWPAHIGLDAVTVIAEHAQYDRIKKQWVNGANVECLFHKREGVPILVKRSQKLCSQKLISPSIGAKQFAEDEVDEPEDLSIHLPNTYKLLSFCMGDLDNVCFSSSQLNVSAPQYLHEVCKGKINVPLRAPSHGCNSAKENCLQG
ncbi:uncharacterized protein C8Q71DRAFT_720557 [Rhodofomes roseus]|uniref:Uncharacterized protein n=1 Tax=Rhodofomes roseus TaxID=34475 RepID=A0ABQ8KRB3_9APHY|nr:uncharacterized protein C8Q71DRAFT_720557 [Rhodofomes roseus]KAH9841329.1 hypothetical protein C8Q71DRAFT_720557 [Rhodofomes roseus]